MPEKQLKRTSHLREREIWHLRESAICIRKASKAQWLHQEGVPCRDSPPT
jgi:hypothetical protein